MNILSLKMTKPRIWLLTEYHGVTLSQSPILTGIDIIRHGVTTRHDGANLSFRTEPDREKVITNRQHACESLGASLADLVFAEQVHGCGVAVAVASDRGKGAQDYATSIPGADALVTNVPGVLLGITIADCLPVFLLDPINRAIGLAHSGWRGTAGAIACKTLEVMAQEYGTRSKDVFAAVGPGIQGSCYEVDDRVRDSFPSQHYSGFRASRPGHWLLDLRAVVVDELTGSGVSPYNIDVCPDCTHCRTDLFFSHHAEGPQAGRMGALLMLAP